MPKFSKIRNSSQKWDQGFEIQERDSQKKKNMDGRKNQKKTWKKSPEREKKRTQNAKLFLNMALT